MKFRIFYVLSVFIFTASAFSYPLDGFDETNISRLDGYFHALQTDEGLKNLSAGALLSITELKLSKPGIKKLPRQSSSLVSALSGVIPAGANFALLNLSDPKNPEYAGINDSGSFVPGSVGKVMVVVSLLKALADEFPSVKDREKILRERFITANEFIETDEHVVPFWDETNRKIYFRPIHLGERANLWTYLDWALSASSNAAAGMVMREVLLLNHFGINYPPTASEEAAFFRSSAPQGLMSASFVSPLASLGFGNRLFQGSFFTKGAKSRISGVGSSATARDLVQLLLMIEEGALIDEWSSLEMKRLLYLTQHRERYVGIPSLDDAAVYFKAGSLYRCGGPCEKYEGTLQNMLNALVVVEDPVAVNKTRYLLALSTNVVRQNSERLHQSIAEKVHRIIKNYDRSN